MLAVWTRTALTKILLENTNYCDLGTARTHRLQLTPALLLKTLLPHSPQTQPQPHYTYDLISSYLIPLLSQNTVMLTKEPTP